ncbi:hypothetical protein V5E97_07650 [Singulisphaera sp. Ch08]|uniref:Uncharacterized protein n=1 Tax=Singulisphaera sp. Ch08 TaxID=3120278 RepID=A0AAU7CL66_9BACT
MKATFRSCLAMSLSLLIGIAYGAITDHYAPVSAGSFLCVGGTSVTLLAIAAACRFPAPGVGSKDGGGSGGDYYSASLASFAGLLVALDVYRGVSDVSLLSQVLSTVPFLREIGCAVRRKDWLAGCGAAGFFVTAVAMLYCNRGGGWAGFYSVYCP